MSHQDRQVAQMIAGEIDSLPEHFHDTFSSEYLNVLAILRLHSFVILRADEAEILEPGQDLWPELSHPSVWLCAPAAQRFIRPFRDAEPGSYDHTSYLNQIIAANLKSQQALLH